MSRNSFSAPPSDLGLEQAKGLAARILDFIASDRSRLRRFLQLTGFHPDAFRESAQSPLFILTVLNTVADDQQLLRALEEHEQITPDMIEMTRARLAFQVSVEAIQQGRSDQQAVTVKEKVQHQLRALLRRLRRQAGGKSSRHS